MSQPDATARIPIIQLWGQLIVTLQGDLTDRHAAVLTSDVLDRIQQTGARGLVLDISGTWLVDSHLCSVLAQLASAAKLMGTRTVITGMAPEVAMTLQSMGVALEGAETALGLEEGLTLLGLTAHVAEGVSSDELIDFALQDAPAARPNRLTPSNG